MQRTPYFHNNQSLALALHLAGFSLIHTERQYTKADEDRFGLRARDCASKDLGGALYFYHAWDDAIPELVKAYDAAAAEDAIETQAELEPEDIVRLVAQTLKSRAQLAQITRSPKVATLVRMKGEATVQKLEDGGAILKHPGFIKISDTDAMREKTGFDR
jgi:hypothetical protein